VGKQSERLLLFLNVLLILSLNSLLASCGYHLQYKRSLPDGVKKIVIPVFENQGMQPNAEVVLNREEADAILQGTITEFRVSQVARTPVVFPPSASPNPPSISIAREYLVSIYVTVKLIRTSDDKVIWENQLWNTERYLANPGGEPDNTRNEDRRRVAIKLIAASVGEYIHDSLTWGF
jgi:hypothetical protein